MWTSHPTPGPLSSTTFLLPFSLSSKSTVYFRLSSLIAALPSKSLIQTSCSLTSLPAFQSVCPVTHFINTPQLYWELQSQIHQPFLVFTFFHIHRGFHGTSVKRKNQKSQTLSCQFPKLAWISDFLLHSSDKTLIQEKPNCFFRPSLEESTAT